MRDLTPLCLLAKKYQTDKGGRHLIYGGVPVDTCHEYTPAYHDLFADRRMDVKRVLEVGVNAGGSLKMWSEFFPNAEIVGLDIRRNVLYDEGKIKCFYADQGDEASLLHAIAESGPALYDLIIDDGSHELAHQILTANTLMQFLAPDGIYVIEDIHRDCTPSSVTDFILPKYHCSTVQCEQGIGKAKCGCCGAPYETLILIRR